MYADQSELKMVLPMHASIVNETKSMNVLGTKRVAGRLRSITDQQGCDNNVNFFQQIGGLGTTERLQTSESHVGNYILERSTKQLTEAGFGGKEIKG